MSAGIAIAGSLALSVAVYAWAIRAFFLHGGALPGAMRILTLAGFAACLCQVGTLMANPPEWGRSVAGTSFHIAGLALFAWVLHSVPSRRLPVAHSPASSLGLATTGPFSLLRHPCYTAYALTWLGACVARPHWGTIAPACWMIAWYVLLARSEDRRLRCSALAEDFERYRRRVTWFGPNPFAERASPDHGRETQPWRTR